MMAAGAAMQPSKIIGLRAEAALAPKTVRFGINGDLSEACEVAVVLSELRSV